MAVVTTKSAFITNRDATPKVLTNARLARGDVQHARGVVTAVNGDSIGSKYIFFQIASNALPIDLRISCPDIGTTGAGDVGLYRTVADGGAVVDVDFFASAVSVSGGALAKTSIINEAGNIATPANGEKAIWELLGLSADPGIMYDVVMTLTAAQDAGGAILLEGDFAV
jgi:hypothetical protein